MKARKIQLLNDSLQRPIAIGCLVLVASFSVGQPAYADDVTWRANPVDGNWVTP